MQRLIVALVLVGMLAGIITAAFAEGTVQTTESTTTLTNPVTGTTESTMTVQTQSNTTAPAITVEKTETRAPGSLTVVEDWAVPPNPIERVMAAGLMSGYPDGKFHAEGKLTRAELAHILVKAFDIKKRIPEKGVVSVPADVPSTHWAYDDIVTVMSRDVMEGYHGNTFNPGQVVTRGEAYPIIAQAYGVFQLPPEQVNAILAEYRDSAQIPDWGKKATATALQEGFVNTDERSGYIHPNQPMTRGDMAYALSKVIDNGPNPTAMPMAPKPDAMETTD